MLTNVPLKLSLNGCSFQIAGSEAAESHGCHGDFRRHSPNCGVGWEQKSGQFALEVRVSDCLHCDINELVRQHLDRSDPIDLPELAARIAESLVDLILLAPDEQQGNMLAEAVLNLGHAFLEKSGVIEGESVTAH